MLIDSVNIILKNHKKYRNKLFCKMVDAEPPAKFKAVREQRKKKALTRLNQRFKNNIGCRLLWKTACLGDGFRGRESALAAEQAGSGVLAFPHRPINSLVARGPDTTA